MSLEQDEYEQRLLRDREDEYRRELDAADRRKAALHRMLSLSVVITSGLLPIVAGLRGLESSLANWLSVLFTVIASAEVFAAKAVAKTLQTVTARIYEVVTSKLKTKQRAVEQAAAVAAVVRAKRTETSRSSLAVLAALGAYFMTGVLTDARPSVPVVLVLAAALVALQLGAIALSYRVNRGLYGTNAYEAREIVVFVLQHADKIDLSGGLGAEPLDLAQGTESAMIALWEGARA